MKKKSQKGTARRQWPRKQAGASSFWPFQLQSSLGQDPSPNYTALVEAYPGHPALKQETIYAIPTPLIDAISREVHDFFSAGDEAFERKLARLAGTGFFLGRPINYPPLYAAPVHPAAAGELLEWEERHGRSNARIRELLNDEMRQEGISDEQIERYWKDEVETQKRIEARRWGYVGWLATDPGFRRARRLFRDKWLKRIEALGGFPDFPMSYFGERPSSPKVKDRPFYDGCIGFYRSWSLHSLATWDLPIPMRPDTFQPSLYHLPATDDAGITIFVPWHLLRDKDLKIAELTKHKLTLKSQPHLEGWFNGEKNWGYDRFAIMLKLYVYLELCLKARYPDRVAGHLEKLDYALGYFLAQHASAQEVHLSKADSIRKIRQEMARRLKQCTQPDEL
jgi:hypothetical protein